MDVVAALTDSGNPQTYWRVLKKRLLDEGDQTVTNCNVFKMLAADGKMRQNRCCRSGAVIPSNSVNSIAEGRAVQSMDGSGGIRENR